MADGKKTKTTKKTKKEQKNYEFTTADGKFNFRVIKPNGVKGYSISGFYPVISQTETGLRKLSRKEVIAWCLKVAHEDGRL